MGPLDRAILFRPFPDNETAELLALHLTSRRVVGLQIKTVEVDTSQMRSVVDMHERMLIPSMELRSFARDDGFGHLAFHFAPAHRNTACVVMSCFDAWMRC